MKTPNEALELMEVAKNKAYSCGKNYVNAKAEYLKHDSLKKIFFANIVSQQEGKSFKEKENLALLSGEWKGFVEALVDLEINRDKWRLEQDRWIKEWETCRSILSALKQELRTLGG